MEIKEERYSQLSPATLEELILYSISGNSKLS